MSKKIIKAYKVFDHEWKCKGFQFEVGKTYTFDGDIKICEKGFHACLKLEDCFRFYPAVTWNHIAEVEILGKTQTHSDDSKIVTDKIKIVREIEWGEINNDFKGINYGRGINDGWGIDNCFGVDSAIFAANKKRVWTLFNKEVSKEKFEKVWDKLNSFVWYPKFNNAFEFYIQKGNNWKKVPANLIKKVTKKKAWSDIPKEMEDYLKSLEEFDEKIFNQITGRNDEN